VGALSAVLNTILNTNHSGTTGRTEKCHANVPGACATFSVGTYKAVSGPMWQYGRCLHSATDHAEGLAFLALALTAGFVEEVSLKAGSSQRSYSAGVRVIGIRSCMSVRSEFAVVVNFRLDPSPTR